MKGNKISKIVAIIALLAIMLWLAWTWLLIFFSSPPSYQSEGISIEQLQDLIWSWGFSENKE